MAMMETHVTCSFNRVNQGYSLVADPPGINYEINDLKFAQDAKAVFEFLQRALPGGTYDVLVELMKGE